MNLVADHNAFWATVQTKRHSSVDVSPFGPPGKFALGKIAGLGREREIVAAAGKLDQIKMRLDTSTQVDDPAFARFVKEHAQQP